MRTPAIEVLGSQTVWQSYTRLDVVRYRVRGFDGAMRPERSWEVFVRGPAAGMLPYDPITDQVLLIEQFRYPALRAGIDPVLMEIPGGFMEAGETPEQAATREMREETGCAIDLTERIGHFILSAGGSDETVTIFAGRIAAPHAGPDGIVGYGGLAQEHEDLRIRIMPADDAIASALAGLYANSITTIALLWLAQRRDWLRAQWTQTGIPTGTETITVRGDAA